MSDRTGTPLLADTAAAVLAPVYIGLPLGSLVGVHAIGGREAVLLLIATVAVSDTAQFYTGRRSDARRWRRCAARRRRAKARIGGFVIAPVFLAVAGVVLAADLSVVWPPRSASASSWPASSAICSSRC